MKHFYLSPLIILYLLPGVSFVDPIDEVAQLIRQGNIHELSKMFSPNIEITILDEENVYSKAQAELILDKFFSQNKPRAVKILHKISSNPNYRFAVLIVNTDKGPYRVAYTLKATGGNLMMTDIQIDREMVK
ncbi:MAG TPA: DUF4783 domain-containing protein [Mucilaginibacter sp.]|jgi:hypothetical protein